MDIFILTVHQVVECEDVMLKNKPFMNLDDAKKEFKNLLTPNIMYAHKHDWRFESDKNNETYFCAYEEGRYSSNHILIQIKKHRLNTWSGKSK